MVKYWHIKCGKYVAIKESQNVDFGFNACKVFLSLLDLLSYFICAILFLLRWINKVFLAGKWHISKTILQECNMKRGRMKLKGKTNFK